MAEYELWNDNWDCLGIPGSATVATAVYTMMYATAGVILGVVYGVVFISSFEEDLQGALGAAFGVMIAWNLLQLLVSVLCLIGCGVRSERLMIPYAVVKFLTMLLFFAGGLAFVIKAGRPALGVGFAGFFVGMIFASLEWVFFKIVIGNFGNVHPRPNRPDTENERAIAPPAETEENRANQTEPSAHDQTQLIV